jgi:hypothetical protein
MNTVSLGVAKAPESKSSALIYGYILTNRQFSVVLVYAKTANLRFASWLRYAHWLTLSISTVNMRLEFKCFTNPL